jgi:ABC-type oligopeptide transport system substrate-binding subunit
MSALLIPLVYPTATAPFEVESSSTDELRLRRHPGRGTGIETIDVLNMPSEEEEWRRFLAREVDLVPLTTPSHLQYLKEIPSIRIVKSTDVASGALIFHVQNSPVSDQRVRKAISLALRRKAIAQTVTGVGDYAYGEPEDLEQARAIVAQLQAEGSMPGKIRLLAPATSTDFQRAALVIEEQLVALGFDVQTRAVPADEIEKIVEDGGFDMLVFYGTYAQANWGIFQLPGDQFTAYHSAEFDAAASRHAAAEVEEILRRDLPLTPLYHVNQGIAVDRRFCNVHPRAMDDLSWLGDIHLCSPEEDE